MAGRAVRSIGLAIGLLMGPALVGGCRAHPRPLGDAERWQARGCVAEHTVEHEASPLAELRELGGWRDDFQDRFPAAVIDPEHQRPVTAAATLRLDGQPIAWFTPTLDAVVLDGAAFAPLRRADATRLLVGERQVVGRVTARARQALGDRAVIELLLRVGAIGSYWHLGADLCLTAEQAHHGAYHATFEGVHQYATDRDREAAFAFAVEIDAEGEIAVTGREAPS